MTPAREAVVLPLVFITVAALGGLRIGDRIQLVPPPLVSLVLGVFLIGTLVRGGLLAPDRLMSTRRSALENLNGLMVLLALLAGSAQVFTLVTPDTGLLHAVFSIAFFVQLATTLAGIREARALLRSLTILLGCAFVLRFLVLDTLYAPQGGWGQRVLMAVLEGASLGSIVYQSTGTLTGYIAFAALALYLIGLLLLPRVAPTPYDSTGQLEVRSRELVAVLLLLGVTSSAAACGRSHPEADPPADAALARLRDDALARARVWHPPETPISEFDFTANPPGGFAVADDVDCEFTVQKLTGRTQKFHCQLPDGRIVKVKYGAANGELQAEIAGTRLLQALGFRADDMFVVHSVRCAGCPRFPFAALLCHQTTGIEPLCFHDAMDPQRVRVVEPVVIERRLPGTVIEATDDQGWSWFELDRVDPVKGGSTRAEVDALRLLAVVLAHWDNKGPNQRLICPEGQQLPDGGCREPVAIIQDLGATFGPDRVDLQNWRAVPVWRDPRTCAVSMKSLPFGGATFEDRTISEKGRQMLAGLLDQLTSQQLMDLFAAARFMDYDAIRAEARDVQAWVRTFREKIRAVKEGGPCV
jgi:hypothetical protein